MQSSPPRPASPKQETSKPPPSQQGPQVPGSPVRQSSTVSPQRIRLGSPPHSPRARTPARQARVTHGGGRVGSPRGSQHMSTSAALQVALARAQSPQERISAAGAQHGTWSQMEAPETAAGSTMTRSASLQQ